LVVLLRGSGRRGSGGVRRRSHVVVMVVVPMMMMVVVVVMVMMLHRRCFRRGGRSGWRCVLREGVAAEAERENRRGGKGLDHGKTFLWL
jgi:hypothetical protein